MITDLRRERLLAVDGKGRHFASEPHLRIQVLPVPPSSERRELFENYHGELLIICLQGFVTVRTVKKEFPLEVGDQILLIDGEPFAIDSNGETESLVELVWAPGLNPCKTCWEQAQPFFDKPSTP